MRTSSGRRHPPRPRPQKRAAAALLAGFAHFTAESGGIRLRPYQVEAGEAVLASIRERRGDSIVVMMSRQSGKDELCADLKVYLLTRFLRREAGIVEVNPTYKPQTINAIDRLDRRLEANHVTRRLWRKRSDFIRRVGRARVAFLSGEPEAQVVGATASLLLIVNEAQEIEPAVYDGRFAPMAASTNATRLFLGTAWTSRTLLARELRSAREAERRDGRRRVFLTDADEVRRHVPAYGAFVDAEIARLGRGHLLIRTQYFNEEVDAQAGMFHAGRRALMLADAPPALAPLPGRLYAFCIDVGGMDESRLHTPAQDAPLANAGRDSTTLSILEIDLSTLPILQAPTYRVVQRRLWTGLSHLAVFGQLNALADAWRPRHIVVDATGVGEGLWAMLDRAFPTRIIPVKFSASVKSEIGYRFLAIIDTGRFKDCCTPQPAAAVPSEAEVSRQYAACISEVLPGPGMTLRWGVPDGTRDENGELIHDDLLLADSLCAVLDKLPWFAGSPALIVRAPDPLDDLSRMLG